MWDECFLPRSKTPQLAEGQGIIGVVHMEEGVQVRVGVEVGREEQGEGETHGKGQSEEQREQIKRTTWRPWR